MQDVRSACANCSMFEQRQCPQSTTTPRKHIDADRGTGAAKRQAMSATTAHQVLAMDAYDYYGLRRMTRDPITGEEITVGVGESPGWSYRWDDGETTDEPLYGTCALDVRELGLGAALDLLRAYGGGQVVLLAGYSASRGADDHELIIHDAIVVATI